MAPLTPGTAWRTVVTLLAFALVACPDASDLNGTYQEQAPAQLGYPEEQWFAMAIDMFDFEEGSSSGLFGAGSDARDVGGIVRYYTLRGPDKRNSVFHPNNEAFCFWLPAASLSAEQRDLALYYRDIHYPEQVTSVLSLISDNVGDSLSGAKVSLCAHPACDPGGGVEDPRCNPQGCLIDDRDLEPNGDGELPGIRGLMPGAEVDRPLILRRASRDPRNGCDHHRRHIVLDLSDLDVDESEQVLQLGNPNGVLRSDRSARRFTYTVAWAGDDVADYPPLDEERDTLQPTVDLVDLPYVFDWYHRAHDTQAPQQIALDRWLPPGFWSLNDTGDVKVGDRASILVGTYFLYYEDESNFGEPKYDATSALWNPATEPIIAAPFAPAEQANTRRGTVVVWIEGRPSQLPSGIRALFPEDAEIRAGYSLWDAVISERQRGEILRFEHPVNGRSLVRLYVLRPTDQYTYPVHTELSIARLPVAVD
jgi:hypothetical protein